MADLSVHTFVQSLRDLMKSKDPKIARRISHDNDKDQLVTLHNDVFLMSSFLKKIEEKCSYDDEKVNNLVTEIRELVLEAENTVDYFMVDVLSLDLKSLQKQIQKVKIEMDQMNSAFDQSTNLVGYAGKNIQKMMKPRKSAGENLEAVVGIDDTMEKILAGFDGDQEMEVISLVGLPGIGKTTLAQKVFEHSRTRSSFQVRAWVTVSQTYNSKRLLIDIMQSSSLYEDSDVGSSEDRMGEDGDVGSSEDEDVGSSVNRLGEDLLKCLKDKKYLIVLDDIWNIDAWNAIQRSFPPNNNGSKVIFTSRFAGIGKDVGPDIITHNVSGLSEQHSWNLLENKVFGGGDHRRCPPELEKLGRKIAKRCDGLPLAIVVIGGLLAKKDTTTEQWEKVARNLKPSIVTNREAFMKTLALSYQDLPLHLKACFLYLGSIFPEDYAIPVRRLVWLLVAEGFFIQENTDDEQIESSELIVEGYLNELVERSLVTIVGKRLCGSTKKLHIHDLLRDFCVVQGEQEKFSLKLEDLGGHESTLKGHRRLVVPSLHVSTERSTSNLRSLFCDRSFKVNLGAEVLARCFGLLKVLQVGFIEDKFSKKLKKLVHLRYLALLSSFDPNTDFTSSVTKLLYLETLLLRSKKTMDLPDDIWKMVKLRHLYNKNKRGIFHFKDSGSQAAKGSSVLPDLQTLHTLCACRSCLQKLVRTPNLKNLGLLGSLTSSTIPDLGFLEQLVTLKVTSDSFYKNQSSIVFKLRLPASLRMLTLKNTLLKWEEISVLAKLENLEVLKLLDKACVKTEAWDTRDMEFPKLKYLKMRQLDIVKWDDSDLKFESLEVLVLVRCWNLKSIPSDLALSPSLHTIKVTRCHTLMGKVAKDIASQHEIQCGNSDLQVFIKN